MSFHFDNWGRKKITSNPLDFRFTSHSNFACLLWPFRPLLGCCLYVCDCCCALSPNFCFCLADVDAIEQKKKKKENGMEGVKEMRKYLPIITIQSNCFFFLLWLVIMTLSFSVCYLVQVQHVASGIVSPHRLLWLRFSFFIIIYLFFFFCFILPPNPLHSAMWNNGTDRISHFSKSY